jgi:hypothetical protein
MQQDKSGHVEHKDSAGSAVLARLCADRRAIRASGDSNLDGSSSDGVRLLLLCRRSRRSITCTAHMLQNNHTPTFYLSISCVYFIAKHCRMIHEDAKYQARHCCAAHL